MSQNTETMVAPASPSSKAAAFRLSMRNTLAVLIRKGSIMFLCALAFILGSMSSPGPQGSLRKIQVDDGVKMTMAAVGLEPWDEEAIVTDAADSSLDEQINQEAMYQDTIHKMQTENRELQAQIDTLNKKYHSKNRARDTLFSELANSSPEVKDEVIGLIIKNFISSASLDKRYDKLESAFQAIDFRLTDGEPVQVEDYPFLFVGTVGASLNHQSLKEYNITHVVNWSTSARCDVWEDMEYLCVTGIHGSDIAKPENLEILRDAVEFVEEARLAGGNVLSHCWYGRNRSVTLLVAYLMKYADMSIDEATNQVAKTRPQADPYDDALRQYKKLYLDV
jgi:hypothetical protein